MNFRDLLREHHIPTAPEGHHHARPGWVQMDCPFCSPNSSKWRLGWNLTYNYGNCWTCGAHGLIEVMTAITLEPARNFIKFLADLESEGPQTTKPTRRGNLEVPKGIGPLQGCHRKFLTKRGFDSRNIESLWGVKGIGYDGHSLSWRLFIPIYFQGETVSWTTRGIYSAQQPSYLTARPDQESIFHKDLLYGEDFVRHTCIVQEGPLDVWTIGPGAVCTFGLNYSPKQIARIRHYPRRIICFDNEPAAQRKARQLCDLLQAYPGETINVRFETGKDASRADRREVNQLRKQFLED